MKKIFKLLKIEGRLAVRSVDGIVFGICMPIAVIILIGAISGQKPAFDGADYTLLESSFGGLITVGICATAFMGIPLTISDYRDKKILKHFFVTPVSPGMLLLVHGVINMITSIVSALGVYMAVKIVFGYEMRGSKGAFILSYFFVMISMYSLGMLIASVCKNVKIANVVSSAVYFPMLFLSGATVPFEIFPATLRHVSNILPLTQGIKLLKGYSLGQPQENLVVPIVVMIISIIMMVNTRKKMLTWKYVKRLRKKKKIQI